MTPRLVSVHGGHSGQFCSHATDTLSDVVRAYIDQGFAWVGITEHMPAAESQFIFKEERDAGLDVQAVARRFDRYFEEGRRLQEKYAGQLEIFIGFETEAHTGALDRVRHLVDTYQPDYIVGSVHHVLDIPFDFGPAAYRQAVAAAGGIEALYCRYFDRQYEMLQAIKPQVVGHFDLIRLFDEDYAQRWQIPAIASRIARNLDLVRQLDLILDFNMAALRKGAAEPYISAPILSQVAQMGLAVAPGDDSHGVATVGGYVAEGAAILASAGISTEWRKPMAR